MLCPELRRIVVVRIKRSKEKDEVVMFGAGSDKWVMRAPGTASVAGAGYPRPPRPKVRSSATFLRLLFTL